MNSSEDLLIQHTAFSAHKTLHLLEGLGVKDVFFFFFKLGTATGGYDPPAIKLGNETDFSLFCL